MPTKIGLHAFHINPYLYEFFELILFFDPHDLKGNLVIYESSNIFETEEATPTKIGVYASYLREFFEPILID